MICKAAVLLLIGTLSTLLTSVHSRCAFSQNCTNPSDPHSCGLPFAVDTEPFEVKSWTMPPVCADLMVPGAKLCCNDGQNSVLQLQIQFLGITFGSIGGDGGCDICAANLMRYFCHFTCNPEQATYLQVNGYVNATDPFSHKNKTVLSMNYTNTYETACQIYESCKNVAYVAQMPSMQSGKGLLNLLGQNAPVQGPTIIDMFYDPDPAKGIYLPNMDKCSEEYQEVDKWGYKIFKNCSCNNCQQMCQKDPWDYRTALPGDLEGLDLYFVLFLYGSLILIAGACQFGIKRRLNKEKNDVKEIIDDADLSGRVEYHESREEPEPQIN